MPVPKLDISRSERRLIELRALLFGALVVWLGASWLFLIQRLFRYHSAFPAWDYWRVIYDLAHLHADGLRVLLRPHNEHRIIFPELFGLLDARFGGRTILPVITSAICYAFTFVLLATLFVRDRAISPPVRTFGVLLAGILLSWPGSAVVVGDPFLLQWTLSTVFAIVAIICVVRRHVAIALIAAVMATYSSGNCLLLWPVLLLEGLFFRLPRRRLIMMVGVSIISVGAYFIGYHPDNNLKISVVLSHPLQALGFLTSFMGMPFGLGKSDALGTSIGAANITCAVFVFILALRRKILRSETAVALFSTYLFTFLTALIVMQGRFSLASGYGDAKASRFWSIQLLGWTALALLLLWFSAVSKSRALTPVVVGAIALGLFGFSELKLRSSLTYDDDQFANRQLAGLSFENGLDDPGLARRIFPSPAFVSSFLPYLEANHLSVYGLPQAGWLGKSAQVAGSLAEGVHPGAITYTFPVDGGIELAGWTEPDHNGAAEIVLLNEQHRIVGVGRKLHAAFPLDLRNPATPEREGWVAFVNSAYGAHTITPCFVRRGRLQPIGTDPLEVDNGLQSLTQDMGKPLSGVQWQRDPAWVENGVFELRDPGDVPHGIVYGTSSHEDTKTGQITSSVFPAPPNSCLLLPVSHGPNAEHLSIRVVNADTGKPIKAIPLQNGDWGWRFWQIKLPASVQHLQIIGKDEGRAWGEWLAVATPSECTSF